MSYDKTMEELLVSARKAPAELTYDEVEFLFLNPTLPPPARPWWRGGYLKFLIMLTLIVSFLAFFLPSSVDGTEYQLSAFPVQEETPVYVPVNALSVATDLLALDIPPIDYTEPEVRLPAPQPFSAPAAAPEKTQAPEASLPVASPVNASAPQARTTRMPDALFSGRYDRDNDSFTLSFTEEDDGLTHLMFVTLSPEEQRKVKNAATDQIVLERAAGSLLLFDGAKKGIFEFLPNPEYRAALNARGWGDAAAPEEGIIAVTTGKPAKQGKKAGSRKSVQPLDQLWFRYFTENINDDYIGALRRAGYTETDLGDLWNLANFMVSYEKLKSMLNLTAVVFTDRPPLASLSGIEYDLDDLKKMKSSGERKSYEEFQLVKKQTSSFELFSAKKTNGTRSQGETEAVDDRFWSTEYPGTISEKIGQLTKDDHINMKGNFKVRISKDPEQQKIIAYGPEKAIKKMLEKSHLSNARLVNPRKKQTIYLDVPVTFSWTQQVEKGVTVTVKREQE